MSPPGAGFSTVDSLVGIAEYNESNFTSIIPSSRPGSWRRAELAGCGPRWAPSARNFQWLNRALVPGSQVAIEHRLVLSRLRVPDPNNIYDQTRAGAKVGLESALWGNSSLRGGVSSTFEDVGIGLTSDAVLPYLSASPGIGRGHPSYVENSAMLRGTSAIPPTTTRWRDWTFLAYDPATLSNSRTRASGRSLTLSSPRSTANSRARAEEQLVFQGPGSAPRA